MHREAARVRAEHRIPVNARLVQDLLGSATAQRVRHRLAVPVLAVCRPILEATIALSGFAKRTSLEKALLEVRLGPAAATIRERAEQVGADLVVMAPSRKSWLERLLLFVNDAMLSNAKHDVLITLSARRLRPVSLPQSHVGDPKWKAMAGNSASASRAHTAG